MARLRYRPARSCRMWFCIITSVKGEAEVMGVDGCCGEEPGALEATGERPVDGDDDSAGTRKDACNRQRSAMSPGVMVIARNSMLSDRCKTTNAPRNTCIQVQLIDSAVISTSSSKASRSVKSASQQWYALALAKPSPARLRRSCQIG